MASYPYSKRAATYHTARPTCSIDVSIIASGTLATQIIGILQECGLYNVSVEGSRNIKIRQEQRQFLNTIMNIYRLYNQTYMRSNSSSIEDKLQNMNRCFNEIFEQIGTYIISKFSSRSRNIHNIANREGVGMTGEFLSLRSNQTKGIKFRTYSNTKQIAKLFLEFLIFKLLYLKQMENEVEIMRKLRYLPIPSIYSFNKYSNGRYGIEMNRVIGTTLSTYFSTTFNSLSSENKLLKLKSIIRKIADILEIFQNNILFVHCDLAPNNIMIHDEDSSSIGNEQIYIIDLGKALIAPRDNVNVITIRNLTLDSNSPKSFRDSLLSIDLSTLIFSIINVYSRYLDECCISYLFNIMFGRQNIFDSFATFTSRMLDMSEFNKTILNSSIIYALMYFSLTIDGEIKPVNRSNSWEFVRQNPKDKVYTAEEVRIIFYRREGDLPRPYFFNFIREIYDNKLRETKSNRMKAYEFPELSIFKNSFWKQNFYMLLNEWFNMINLTSEFRITLFAMPIFYNIFIPVGLKVRIDKIENPSVGPTQPVVRVNNSAEAPQMGKRKSMNGGGKKKQSTKKKKKKITKKK